MGQPIDILADFNVLAEKGTVVTTVIDVAMVPDTIVTGASVVVGDEDGLAFNGVVRLVDPDTGLVEIEIDPRPLTVA